MRLALKAGLLPLWRDGETLQIGVDPRRGVTVSGIGGAAALIGLLDGSRDRTALTVAARAHGIADETADRVIALLAAAGVLEEYPAGTLRALPEGARSRLRPELATASLAHGDGDGGARALARRAGTYVRVHGAGKVGSGLAALLAGAGIGHVACRDEGPAVPADLGPAGLGEADIGRPRAAGVTRAIGRTAPDVRTDDARRRPDVVVLAGRASPELAAELMADGMPHLTATADEAIGVVGPLVLPGRSACLRCLDMTRAEHDPAWPVLAAQLTGRQPATPACDCVLAASVVAQAGAQLLAFVDRGRAGAVTNGSLELVLPGWQWQRRTWPPRARCGCGAAGDCQ